MTYNQCFEIHLSKKFFLLNLHGNFRATLIFDNLFKFTKDKVQWNRYNRELLFENNMIILSHLTAYQEDAIACDGGVFPLKISVVAKPHFLNSFNIPRGSRFIESGPSQ